MKILKKLCLGIATGCTIFVMMGLVFTMFGDAASLTNDEFIKQAIGSILVGIGFLLPTIIYDNPNVAMPLKFIVHMGIGVILYVLVALNVGWIPTTLGIMPMIMTAVGMIGISLIIWVIFYMYYKKEAKKINDKIKNVK